MSKLDNLKHIQIQQLKPVDPNHSDQAGAVKFTSNRLNAIEKFVRDSLHQDKEYFAGEKNTLQNIIVTLKEESAKLSNHLQANREQKVQIEGELKISQDEIARLQAIVPPHDERQLQSEIAEIKSKIVQLNKSRCEEANSLNINDLKQLQIKNKDKESPVNDLWVWTLVVIYKEPASSYYWNNFREQVLENAEGAQDFKERLGRVKAVDMKKDEYERTQNLLRQKDKILAAEILTPAVKNQINVIFKIVNLMMEVEEHGNKVHANEKLLQQIAKQKLQIESDTQKFREKSKILQDRIQFLDVIHKGYQYMHDAMVQKIQSYQQAQILNDKFTEQIEQSYTNLDFSKSYNQQYIPPPVETIQHQPIDQQMQQELKEQEQVKEAHLEKVAEGQIQVEEDQQIQQNQNQKVVEVQQTPDDGAMHLQQAPTEIAQTKTGGCEACAIF